MTPYQRGHRDGLLHVAAQLDAIAQRCDAKVASWSKCRRPGSGRQVAIWTAQFAILLAAASICRRRAEALPHDPEVTAAVLTDADARRVG